jgi:hypothetical protein
LFFLICLAALSCNSKKSVDISNIKLNIPIERFDQELSGLNSDSISEIAPDLRKKYSTSKHFEEDKTFAEPPEGWIHHTISVVKGDIPISILDKIIDDTNITLFDLGFVKGNKYSIDELKLRTYDLNHFPIWKKHVEPELK